MLSDAFESKDAVLVQRDILNHVKYLKLSFLQK